MFFTKQLPCNEDSIFDFFNLIFNTHSYLFDKQTLFLCENNNNLINYFSKTELLDFFSNDPISIYKNNHSFLFFPFNSNDLDKLWVIEADNDKLIKDENLFINYAKKYLDLIILNHESIKNQNTYEKLEMIFKNIINIKHSFSYIINDKTYEIVYINHLLKNKYPYIKTNDLCYKTLFHNEFPCENCPIKANLKNSQIYYPEKKRWHDVSVTNLHLIDEFNDYSLIDYIDITDSKKELKKLEKIAFINNSLKIKNRAAFVRDFDIILTDSSKSGAVAIFDIANLKFFNKTYGIKFGDKLIITFAKAIEKSFGYDNTYHFNGDQFIVIIPDFSMEQVIAKITHFKESLIKANNIFTFKYSTSIYPNLTTTNTLDYLNRLIRLNNQNDIEAPTQKHKMQVIDALKRGINNDSFYVVYQPIFKIEGKTYDRAEALLRLNDSELGLLMPTEFIPIAEEQDLITEIGYITIKKVCETINKLTNLIPSFKAININISALQLLSPFFAINVKKILDEYKIDPSYIIFELTESILIQSYDKLLKVMEEILGYGVRFAIDDFGSGYSSLSYLLSFPISSVKLDRIFIEKLYNHEKCNILLKCIINLAKDLKIETIAEGVELEPQAKLLKEYNCDYIQGYYYSKPLIKEKFIELIKKKQPL